MCNKCIKHSQAYCYLTDLGTYFKNLLFCCSWTNFTSFWVIISLYTDEDSQRNTRLTSTNPARDDNKTKACPLRGHVQTIFGKINVIMTGGGGGGGGG